jgi:DHA2 family multidrug resistance protein-like MFS transporter
VLLLLRALQALGAAMALSVSAAMLRQIYPARQLGSGMGINSVIVASASALAPTAGGFIVGHAPWQWVFVAAVPFTFVSLLLGRALPDPVRKDHPPQWLSGLWSALTMLLLIGGLQLATHENFAIGAVLALCGVVSLVLLVRRERARMHRCCRSTCWRRPVLGLSALGAVMCFIAAGSLMLSLPFRFEEALGYAPRRSACCCCRSR